MGRAEVVNADVREKHCSKVLEHLERIVELNGVTVILGAGLKHRCKGTTVLLKEGLRDL